MVGVITSQGGSDFELLERYARAADAQAFAQLVRRYIDLVYSAALRQVRDAHVAEDVTQEVFVLLCREAKTMDVGVILAAWLYRATRLVSCNVNKKASRRRRHEMASVTQAGQRGPEGDGGGSGSGQWDDLMPLLDEAMAGLRESDRTAILLRYFRGQSMKEVGAALGLEANSASKRVERAVEKLRAFFARKGVAVGAAAMVGALQNHAVHAAPVHLAEAVSAAAIGGAAVGSALGKGLVIGMATATKVKLAAGVALVVVLTAVGTTIAYLAGALGGGNDPGPNLVAAPAPATASAPPGGDDPPIVAGGPDDVRLPGGRWASETPDYVPGGTKPMFNNHRRPPREIFRTIHAEHFNDQSGAELLAPGLAALDEGDWVLYSGVNFGQGGDQRVTGFSARLCADQPADAEPRTILLRIDRTDGPVIATLTVTPTGGPAHWTTQAAPITTALSGAHDVYLTFAGGKNVAALDWFKFVAKRPPAGRLEAESYDDAQGIQDGAFFICHLDRPDYVCYRGVDFGQNPGPKWLHVRMGVKEGWDNRIVQVRLDKRDAPPIAGLFTKSTGTYQNMLVQTAPCPEVSGVHDVYVTFSGHGAGDIDWFEFSSSEIPPDEGAPPAAQAQEERADAERKQPQVRETPGGFEIP